MKELKFRAWFKPSETYIDPMSIQEMILDKKNTFTLEQLNDYCIFEQYTGMKDVDGDEIYVGDILEVSGFTEQYRPIYNHNIEVKSIFEFSQMYHKNLWLKVIGNIHKKGEKQ